MLNMTWMRKNQKIGSRQKVLSWESLRSTMENNWCKKFIWYPRLIKFKGHEGLSLVFMATIEFRKLFYHDKFGKVIRTTEYRIPK